MANSLRNVLQTYSEIWIFCVIQYMDFQKQSMGSALKLLGKSLKTVLDEVHFMVSVPSFSLSPSLPGKPFVPQVIHLLPFQAEQLTKLPPLLDTSTITIVFIVLSILSHSLANLENSMIKR